jgi:hypothetical protein
MSGFVVDVGRPDTPGRGGYRRAIGSPPPSVPGSASQRRCSSRPGSRRREDIYRPASTGCSTARDATHGGHSTTSGLRTEVAADHDTVLPSSSVDHGMLPAIDMQRLAGHSLGEVGAEEDDDVGDVGIGRDPTQRERLTNRLDDILELDVLSGGELP